MHRSNEKIVTMGLFALTASTGCTPPEPLPKGLYYHCEGTAAGNSYKHEISGAVLDDLNVCLDPKYFDNGGNDEVNSDEIDLDDWVHDTEDLEFLREICVSECTDRDQNDGAACDVSPWDIQAIQGNPWQYVDLPLDWDEVEDPGFLGCDAALIPIAENKWETTILGTGSSPVWPSNSSSISVACTDFGSCADEFVAPLRSVLFHDDTLVPWDEDMGFGDYLATSTGSSSLELTFVNPGATPSSDSAEADGRVEYSAPDCGAGTCPFYLANLTLSNTSDTWRLFSESLSESVYVSNVSVQLRRPTLGIWKTATGEFYIDSERLEMYITGTVRIGSGLPSVSHYAVMNVDGIYGEIGAGGEIEILDFVADDGGNVELEADLVYDSLDGSPPIANHGMGLTVVAPSGVGLPIAILADISSDPDNDIVSKRWFVDGVERVAPYVIPTGPHTIELRVRDSRTAVDIHKSAVLIVSP